MTVAQFLTLLSFIILNFLILFAVRTRNTTIISLIIANLIAVLFFSVSITNYSSLKEIILALIIYSMVVLFLISNYNSISSNENQTNKINIPARKIIFVPIFTAAILIIFLSLFFVTKNISQVSEKLRDMTFDKENIMTATPLAESTYPADDNIKKDDLPNKIYSSPQINNAKKARLKDKLSENFLLKRSSDMILLIVAVSSSLLILLQKKEN